MVLLYGMPALIAQGLLFFGFIYVMAYAIHFFEYLFKKRKKTIQPLDTSKENFRYNSIVRPQITQNVKTIVPKYKVILRIKSDLAKMNNGTQYAAIALQAVQAENKNIPIQEVCNITPQKIVNFGEIEECIESYWTFEIEDSKFDENKLKFICISKDTVCNDLSIYSVSEIIYNGKKYNLQRIENLDHLTGYMSAIAFDNWVNNTGINNRPPIGGIKLVN